MTFDAGIIGAGPSGAALAIALARLGASVVVLDGGSSRANGGVEVLDRAVAPSLFALGAWKAFSAHDFDESSATLSDWSANPTREPSVCRPGSGWVVVREAFDEWLKRQVASAGVEIVPTHCRRAEKMAGHWLLTTPRRTLRCRLLVQAQGRGRSIVGDATRQVGANGRDVAVIARAQARCADPILRLERAETGWWYSVTTPRHGGVLANVLPLEHLPRGGELRRAWWERSLARTRSVRDDLAVSLTTWCRPAGASLRKEIHGDDWVCVGEAAACYDPLSGSGVAAALAKGVALGRLLAADAPRRAFARYADAERTAFGAHEYARAHWSAQ